MMKEYPVQTAILIDDSEVDLFVHKRFLEIREFASQILTFKSAKHALDELQSTHRNGSSGIVFLDLNMPFLSGFDFLDLLCQSPQSKLQVVVLTSSNSIADRERAQSYKNVISFIPKPLTVQGLDELARLLVARN